MSVRTHVLPALMVLIGIAAIARTLAAGGGVTASGLLLGVLLVVAGGLRLWAETRSAR